MKKTLTVNLNKIVFHIDEDAYQLLQSYLNEVAHHFQKNDEKNDIMFDIEARISELFSEKTKTQNSVITIEDVKQMIETMGKPSQYTEEAEEGANDTNSTQNNSHTTHKKLYRDIDNHLLGGVLSGLSAYLNWDVIALRIIFLLLVFFTSGSFAIAYIIMWLIVPKAISVSQKMEMRGEHVTIDSLNKKKVDTENSHSNLYSNSQKRSVLSAVLKVLFTIFAVIVIGLVGVVVVPILFALIVVALVLLIILPLILLGLGSTFWIFPEITSTLTSIAPNNITMLAIASLLIVGTPIFALIYWQKGKKQNEQRSSMPYWIALLLLFVGIFMFMGSSVDTVQKLNTHSIHWNKGVYWKSNILRNKKSIVDRDQKIFDNAYTLKENQIIISSIPYRGGNGEYLSSIKRLPNETRVTFAIPIHFVSNWISTENKCYAIKDRATGDRYYVRKIDKNIPLNRVLIVKNHEHQMIELTYIFPPLKEEVKWIDFERNDCDDTIEIPSNSAPDTEFKNIEINKYVKY